MESSDQQSWMPALVVYCTSDVVLGRHLKMNVGDVYIWHVSTQGLRPFSEQHIAGLDV